MNSDVKEIIKKLKLSKHIEGGYYKRTYQSSLTTDCPNGARSINTAIYYLLESHDFSCWHRLKSDEIWHYYAGSDLVIHQIDGKDNLFSTFLGNLLRSTDAKPQCIIPAGNWFSAEVLSPESFTLVGCTVAPGFDFGDFEIGERKNLLKRYPQYETIILKLTRDNEAALYESNQALC
jgi:predicted cupin superfamily sugar epimerase